MQQAIDVRAHIRHDSFVQAKRIAQKGIEQERLGEALQRAQNLRKRVFLKTLLLAGPDTRPALAIIQMCEDARRRTTFGNIVTSAEARGSLPKCLDVIGCDEDLSQARRNLLETTIGLSMTLPSG